MATTIEQYPLEQKKVVKKTIVGIIGWMIVLVFVTAGLVGLQILNDLVWAVISLLVLILILEPIYQWYYYKKYFYDVGADFLMIRKGVITPREVMLNYDKIQDVYMDQDIFDRVFGLWDVHVSTATVLSGVEAHIDGVNHDNGVIIRDLILKKIRKGK